MEVPHSRHSRLPPSHCTLAGLSWWSSPGCLNSMGVHQAERFAGEWFRGTSDQWEISGIQGFLNSLESWHPRLLLNSSSRIESSPQKEPLQMHQNASPTRQSRSVLARFTFCSSSSLSELYCTKAPEDPEAPALDSSDSAALAALASLLLI